MVSKEVNIEKQTTTTTKNKDALTVSMSSSQRPPVTHLQLSKLGLFLIAVKERTRTMGNHGEPWGVSGRCLKDPII